MSQEYSNPARENAPYALPDIEVFHSDDYPPEDDAEALAEGYYWWSCFPGCLPDSEPMGPFDSEAEALADAQEDNYDDAE
jgi:hypothetical protein